MDTESLETSETRLRNNIVPKSWYDRMVTLFVMIIIPVVYWFELWIVLPEFYDENEVWFLIHFVLGNLIMVNVVSNYVALVGVDTSIEGLLMQPKEQWTLCAVCETMVPPRSWHCDACNVCILKRDHHCVFSGCCVGHNNLRYFIFFAFYIFIATLYSCYFNLNFIWSNVEFLSWLSLLKLVFPLAMLVFDFNVSQLYLFITLIVLISCVFTGVLLYHHVNLMLKGMVTHQLKTGKINQYDLGTWDNVKEVLGENWHLTWISAFVSSPLPHDGQEFREGCSSKAD